MRALVYRAFLLFSLALLGTSVSGYAQSLAGLGAIGGTVRDPQGAVVAKAAVTVRNPKIGIERKITATNDGTFMAPSLPPAEGYSISVEMGGFSAYTASNISLHVGEVVNVPVTLTLGDVGQNISVTDAVPLMNTTENDVGALVNQTQITELPINGRRVDQFALLSPGVVQDGNTGEVSFHGVPGGNQFLQDGIDVTQQWFTGNAGGGGGSIAMLSNISQDAVQEFRVEVTGYGAEFGRAAGGVVNTLTKSGTNSIHGSAFWFFRNRTLNATDRYATLNNKSYNPPEYRHQYGGTIGGPIVKDKLFYFVSYEGMKRNHPLVSSITQPSLLTSTGDFLPGVCGASTTQCANATAYIKRFFRTVDRNTKQNQFFFKLNYNQSEKSTFAANFNLVNYFSYHGLVSSVASTNGAGVGTNGNIGTHVRNGRISHTYLFNGTTVNEARFAWNKDRRFQGLATDLVPPNGLLSALTVQGQGSLGVSSNQLPNIQPTEDRFDFVDNLSKIVGKHTLKFGVDIAYLKSVENGIFSGPGSYVYSTVTDWARDLTPEAGDPGTPGKRWQSFSQALGKQITRITIRDYDFFAQDQFKVTRGLTLNYGLRYEYTTFRQPPLNPDFPETGKINQPKTNFAPRVGFAYSMNQDRTVIRGSYGIFYNRMPGASITRLQQLGGVVRKSFTLTGSNASQQALGPTFPNRLTDLSQVSSLGIVVNSGFVKKDLSTPYVQGANLSVQQSLGKNMSMTVSYIMSRGVKFLQRSDLNLGQPSGNISYALYDGATATGTTYSTPYYLTSDKKRTDYNRILQIDNGGRLWYDGLAVEFRRSESRWLQTSVAYTWSHALDLSQGGVSNNYYFTDSPESYYNGTSTINGKNGYGFEKGTSYEDQRHRLVISAIAMAPRKNFSSKFADATLNGWQLAPLFTAAASQGVDPAVVAITPPGGAFGTINGFGAQGPGGTRVPFLPTASLRLGKPIRLDARVTKFFALPKEQKISLSFEAINALNHTYNTAVVTNTYQASVVSGSYRLTRLASAGTGSESGGFPDGTNARRAQVSVRYTF